MESLTIVGHFHLQTSSSISCQSMCSKLEKNYQTRCGDALFERNSRLHFTKAGVGACDEKLNSS